ncbi:MAG: Eco29kI family restriction endonuclease [Syntrophaceae bacterium]
MSTIKPRWISPFNPLDKTNLGESVAKAVLQQPVGLLPPEESFIGAGVYTIYYEGDFSLYKDVSEQNRNDLYRWPIYVGKAVPAGARKGGYGLGADPGLALFKRLTEHAASIELAEDLSLKDFRCRFLVVDDIWIPLAESLLIEMFSPLWNQKIDGFGNHDPGSGRYNQQRSPWDTIHPGRSWAAKLQPASVDEFMVRENVVKYIAQTKIKILSQQEDKFNEK